MFISVLLLALAGILVHASSNSSGTNYFISPPPIDIWNLDYQNNPLWRVGQLVEFQWESDYPTMTISILQNGSPTSQILDGFNNVALPETVHWNVTLGPSFSATGDQNVFYLQVWNGTANNAANVFFTSHYFNITDGNATASSTDGQSATSLSTSTVTASSTALPGPVKIGLGVGLGVGAVLLVGSGLFFGFLLHRRKATQASMSRGVARETHGHLGYGQASIKSPYTAVVSSRGTVISPLSDSHELQMQRKELALQWQELEAQRQQLDRQRHELGVPAAELEAPRPELEAVNTSGGEKR